MNLLTIRDIKKMLKEANISNYKIIKKQIIVFYSKFHHYLLAPFSWERFLNTVLHQTLWYLKQ